MKKIIPLILGLVLVFQVSAFAEINKSISNDQINIHSQAIYKIEGATKSIWMNLSRHGISKSSQFLKDKKPIIKDTLFISFYYSEPKNVQHNISFSSKEPPYFVFSKNGTDVGQPFKFNEIDTDCIFIDVVDKTPILTADKASLVVKLKDGTKREIELPEDILNEWKYILSCNLQEEYKKGT